MANFQIKGSELRDKSGKKIGYMQRDDIRDASGKKIGLIKGNDIRDSGNRKVATIKGREIRDPNNRKLATIADVQKSFGNTNDEITAVAFWLFFVR